MNMNEFESDPFLNSASFRILPYDGNPSVSFACWIKKFKDIFALYTIRMSEEQKISRLCICLTGPARNELDSMEIPSISLEDAIVHLQSKFINDTTKSIARQELAICRQFPGEKIFSFATRLNEAVRSALVEEDENTIRKRLLEEFLDRLVPELQYEVKSERPNEYSKVYELAQHYEILQGARKSLASISVSITIWVAPEGRVADGLINVDEQPGSSRHDDQPYFGCTTRGRHN